MGFAGQGGVQEEEGRKEKEQKEQMKIAARHGGLRRRGKE
jgi:hypothetical protein